MSDRDVLLVRRWIDAYYAYRDDELLALAHPEIELRPRSGLGARLYRGIADIQRWLAADAQERSRIGTFSVGALSDGRVLAEATLDGVPVCALFDVRDGKIAGVTMYISDRAALRALGKIDRAPTTMTTFSVTGTPPTLTGGD